MIAVSSFFLLFVGIFSRALSFRQSAFSIHTINHGKTIHGRLRFQQKVSTLHTLRASVNTIDVEEAKKELMPNDVDFLSLGKITASQGLLCAGAYTLCFIFDINPFVGPTPFLIDFNSVQLAVLFTAPMIGIGYIIDKFAAEPLKQISRDTKIFSVRMLGHDTNPLVAALYAAGISVIAAVTEEVAFRGFLFHYLNIEFGFAAAFLFSSAAFGLIHFPMFGSSVALEMILGAVFAYAYWLSDYNLAVPVLIHGLFDFFTLLLNWSITNAQMKRSLQSAEQQLLSSISVNAPLTSQFDVIARAVFDMFDTDRDGFIEYTEFLSGLRLMGVWFGSGNMGLLPFNLTLEEAIRMFSELDEDSDGRIGYAEYAAMFRGLTTSWMTMI